VPPRWWHALEAEGNVRVRAAAPLHKTNRAAAAPGSYVPTVSDFSLSIKVLSSQCFGSAGCNVTYRVKVTYSGEPLDLSQSYEVTLRTSRRRQPTVGQHPDGAGHRCAEDQEESISTSSTHYRLTGVRDRRGERLAPRFG